MFVSHDTPMTAEITVLVSPSVAVEEEWTAAMRPSSFKSTARPFLPPNTYARTRWADQPAATIVGTARSTIWCGFRSGRIATRLAAHCCQPWFSWSTASPTASRNALSSLPWRFPSSVAGSAPTVCATTSSAVLESRHVCHSCEAGIPARLFCRRANSKRKELRLPAPYRDADTIATYQPVFTWRRGGGWEKGWIGFV